MPDTRHGLDIYSATLKGMTVGCCIPQAVADFRDGKIETATLDAAGKRNHADALRVHNGDLTLCMARQEAWQKNSQGVIHIESVRSISDMIISAATPMKSLIASDPCVVVNCQNTRESGYGCATASRLLFEMGCKGSSHTVSHCGVTGPYVALEQALLLAEAQNAQKIVLCAGERLLDIYPRILGHWAEFSDGAAVAVSEVSFGNVPNVWVSNCSISPGDFMETIEAGEVKAELVDQVVSALDRVIWSAGISEFASLNVLSPSVSAQFVNDVEFALSRNRIVEFSHVGKLKRHFGGADALFRMYDARISTCTNTCTGAPREQNYLIWDFEPSGLLGAALFNRSCFASPQLEMAA
jgi:hypothetical protein